MISGNIIGTIEKKTTITNDIGESVPGWIPFVTLKGWLDLASGESRYTMYNSKVQESTHIFICDYQKITIKPEQCRMVIEGKAYDVLVIDNPMEMGEHLEIYLRYTS